MTSGTIVTTDGSLRSDGRSGWGAIIETPDLIYSASGRGRNARCSLDAELFAILQGIMAVRGHEDLVVRNDSSSALDLCERLDELAQKKFMSTRRRIMPNYEILQSLWRISRRRGVVFEHVPGHAGDVANQKAHLLAWLAGKGVDARVTQESLRIERHINSMREANLAQ